MKRITPKPIENTYEVAEAFELASERERRIWTTNGGDVAHFVLQFLQGSRRREVSQDELATTRTYSLFSNDAEKAALTFVCSQSPTSGTPTPDDGLQLHYRDAALIDFVENRHVRGDLAAQLRSIPAAILQRADFDRAVFPHKQYRAPNIFQWLLGVKHSENIEASTTRTERSYDNAQSNS